MSFDAGIDFRYYSVHADNMPGYQRNQSASTATDPQPGTYYDYHRLRTRVWAQLDVAEDYSIYGRVANEFRQYHNHARLYRFPDEVFIDNLYLDLRSVYWDALDLRIGRQDMYYGGGRIIRDGTPGDVTRSFYFNAIKATLTLTEQSKLDIAGIWQRPKDFWAWGDTDLDLNRYHTRKGGNDMTERGVMLYYTNKETEDLPFELYYVYKDESRWISSTNAKLPRRRYNTLGFRTRPRFTDNWTAEAEFAGQYGLIDSTEFSGERDILACLAYGGTTYTATQYRWQPYATAATLVLSGDNERFDDPAARGTDTGWNPVFGRMIWLSDLMTGTYSFYRLSNLAYPHIETGIKFTPEHVLCVQTGPIFACASDNDNGNQFRGYLAFLRYAFPILPESSERRGAIRGVLKAEVMDVGDYYSQADTAYYIRFELHAKF